MTTSDDTPKIAGTRILDNDEVREIDRRFTYHPPHGRQAGRYPVIRAALRHVATIISECCPKSRELSLALTQLDQAAMNANAAIARREERPDTEEQAPQRVGVDDV